MRRVQRNFHSRTHYLLIGSGRLAYHLQHYLKILNLDYSTWNRRESESPHTLATWSQVTHVLLAISDSAIVPFYEKHLKFVDAEVVHFSGALEVPGLHGAHPLMTFGRDLYDKSFYAQIPFVVTGQTSLQDLLPDFPNPSFQILPEQKPYYHALCVLGGNFTTLLQQRMLQGFTELGLPASAAQPYIEQIVKNVFAAPAAALTGPLARKDFATIRKNLKSLGGDPYVSIYEAFVSLVFPEYQEGTHENPRL